jgi:hypothetical protein
MKRISKKHLQLILSILAVAILSFLMLWACAMPNSNSKGSDSNSKKNSDASGLENTASIYKASKSGEIHMDVFARKTDNKTISHNWTFDGTFTDGGGWHDLNPIPCGTNFVSAPCAAATSRGYGRVDVTVSCANGKIYHNFYQVNKRDWGNWTELSGPPNATITYTNIPALSVVSSDQTSYLPLFIVGRNNANSKKYVYKGYIAIYKDTVTIQWEPLPVMDEVSNDNVTAGKSYTGYTFLQSTGMRNGNQVYLYAFYDNYSFYYTWQYILNYQASETPETTTGAKRYGFGLIKKLPGDITVKNYWIDVLTGSISLIPTTGENSSSYYRPGAVHMDSGRIYLFKTNMYDRIVYNSYINGSWGSWTYLPDDIKTTVAPDVVSWNIWE